MPPIDVVPMPTCNAAHTQPSKPSRTCSGLVPALSLPLLFAVSSPTIALPSLALHGSNDYTITKHTTLGGGLSLGGSYSLTGTIGQHDLGLHYGDAFTLRAGFLSPALGNQLLSDSFE